MNYVPLVIKVSILMCFCNYTGECENAERGLTEEHVKPWTIQAHLPIHVAFLFGKRKCQNFLQQTCHIVQTSITSPSSKTSNNLEKYVNYAGVGYPYAFTAKASCTRNLFSLFASYIGALPIGRKRRVVQIEKKGNEKDWGRKKNNREI